MSAVANIVTLASPLRIDLHGSRDLRRTIEVERSAGGYIYVSVRPQLSRRRGDDHHRGWYAAVASISQHPDRIEIVYHERGGINLFMGDVLFPLLASEAEELAAKFGFTVRRE